MAIELTLSVSFYLFFPEKHVAWDAHPSLVPTGVIMAGWEIPELNMGVLIGTSPINGPFSSHV